MTSRLPAARIDDQADASVHVHVVTVFTDARGDHGNPLGIVRSTERTHGAEQRIATALGFSETVFLDELVEGGGGAGTAAAGRRARIRIFTPATELPFAGHPCVGTAWWLARQGTPVLALDTPAGPVAVRDTGDLVWITGRAAWAPDFAFHRLGSPAEVGALDPSGFAGGRHYAWAWVDETAGHLRSRMFAPALGVPEDQATGSAAVALTARLGRDLAIDQGRGSRLLTRVLPQGAVEVGGRSAAADSRTIDA
jgi:predicted PhzF superfamily epimerase YddE/YHI9